MVFFFYLVCYHYDFAMDPINFERANSLKTPPHIYPEWYFLWSYEVLRGFFFSADLGLMVLWCGASDFLLTALFRQKPSRRSRTQTAGVYGVVLAFNH
ncbi:hypothetical protein ACMAV8_06140 [Helicobacter pylori]